MYYNLYEAWNNSMYLLTKLKVARIDKLKCEGRVFVDRSTIDLLRTKKKFWFQFLAILDFNLKPIKSAIHIGWPTIFLDISRNIFHSQLDFFAWKEQTKLYNYILYSQLLENSQLTLMEEWRDWCATFTLWDIIGHPTSPFIRTAHKS